MAILLKRNKKAMAVARIVCRPRNGEKAIKTPIEKASAVRSGGSSIASRRRNAARNITLCNLCVLCVSVAKGHYNHRDTENTEVAQRKTIENSSTRQLRYRKNRKLSAAWADHPDV